MRASAPAKNVGSAWWLSIEKMLLALPGVAAIVALVFASGALDATREQVYLSEQGQLTDRFGKALEQLASAEITTRLGGIYALERLAFDSSRDRFTITEVLASYVRERAPVSECSKHPIAPGDIQAAVTALARRPVDTNLDHRGVDLRNSCLAGVDLGGRWTFRNMRTPDGGVEPALDDLDRDGDGMFEAVASGDFRNSNFMGSDLTNTMLQDAMLDNSDVTLAKLTRGTFVPGQFKARVGEDGVFLDGKLVGAREFYSGK